MAEIQQQNDEESEREGIAPSQTLGQEDLVNKMQQTLGNLGPPLSSELCIYRVPEKLRKVNASAYTPQIVSIGPLHHGKKSLKKMENHKLRYLKNHLQQFGNDNSTELHNLVSCIKGKETSIRQCYAESFDDISSDQFVKMVLVDAVFIILLFMGKRMVDHHFWILLQFNIRKDLILLENQIPFFILEELYNLAFKDDFLNSLSFRELTRYYFIDYNDQDKPLPKNIKHFTHLVRYFLLPSCPPRPSPSQSCFLDCSKYLSKFQSSKPSQSCFLDCSKHLSKFQSSKQNPEPQPSPSQSCFLDCSKHLSKFLSSKQKSEKAEHLYSATELHQAGVKFKASSSKCMLDIKFSNGILEMPCFKLYDNTESFFRNIMALEQCHYPYDAKICNYIVLLDYLINTVKDVELLVKEKIMVNGLGDHHAAATLVNKLGWQIVYFAETHYSNLWMALNDYYEMPHHTWKATLKDEYFSSPWRGASTVAAVILLVLTFIQTVRSFFC